MFAGMTRRELQTLPAGIALLLNDAIYSCRSDPPSNWPESAYRLIVRQDLAAQCCHPKQTAGPGSSSGGSSGGNLYSHLPQSGSQSSNGNDTSRKTAAAAATRVTECEQDDGMETMDQEVSIILYCMSCNEL
jgi:hypothetical protein